MKKDISTLIVGGQGGSIAEGLIKAIRLAQYNNLSLLEYSNNAAHIYRFEKKFIIKETPDTKNYIKKVLEICVENNIKIIIPGPTWEAKRFSRSIDIFNQNGIYPIVNNIKLIEICNDKWETHKFLNTNNFGTPKTFLGNNLKSLQSNLEYPVVIKPRVGRGSKNIFFARNEKELYYITEYLKCLNINFIIQKYIDSDEKEYTVGIISDRNKKVIDSIVMQRYLGAGYTNIARIIRKSYINDICEEIALKLNSSGPLNIQLRLNENNKPLIFEINPRFSGSAPMRAIAGFNEPDMLIRNIVFKEPLKKNAINYNYRFYRVFQEFYVDDSTTGRRAKIKNYI